MSAKDSPKEDFKLTTQEAESLREALKKEEFRKLLLEYAKEISDPENKKLYEEEITKLEQQRGVDVKFVDSKPGFVLKVPEAVSKRKLFINVCSSDTLDAASPTPSSGGAQWNIPFCITNIREDIDKNKNKCHIIDVYFHPDTYKKGEEDRRFYQVLVDATLDGVEHKRGIKVERKKVKRLKSAYKGVPTPTVIRTRTGEPPSSPEFVDSPVNIPYPPLEEEESAKKTQTSQKKQTKCKKKSKKLSYEPKYSVLYRGEVDMLDFAVDIGSEERRGNAKRPKEIVVTVELPLMVSASGVELDIFERRLLLHSDNPHYHLDLPLSYPVDEEHSSAKFDKSKRSLAIILPVIKSPPPPLPSSSLNSSSSSSSSSLIESETQAPQITQISATNHNGLSESNDTSQPTQENEITDQTKMNEGQTLSSVHANDDQTPGAVGKENSIVEKGPTSCNGETDNLTNATSFDWSVANDSWQCPPYCYDQDDDHVTFVLYVTGVKRSSLNSFFDASQIQVTFKGDQSQTAPSSSSSSSLSSQQASYSFYVRFPEGCRIARDKCDVLVSAKNVVVVMDKDMECQCEWERFEVGLNTHQTSKKLFLTERNVMQYVETMDSLPDPWEQAGLLADAKAELVSVSEKEAVIRVTNGSTSKQEKKQEDEEKRKEVEKVDKHGAHVNRREEIKEALNEEDKVEDSEEKKEVKACNTEEKLKDVHRKSKSEEPDEINSDTRTDEKSQANTVESNHPMDSSDREIEYGSNSSATSSRQEEDVSSQQHQLMYREETSPTITVSNGIVPKLTGLGSDPSFPLSPSPGTSSAQSKLSFSNSLLFDLD